ncbi:MAG: hypothetical protein ACRDOG_08155 [Gaiellaceae bacterium]
MTLPAEARRDIGIADGGSVLIFGLPGRVIITRSPLPDELLAFAAERAIARRDELAAADASESDA